MVLPASDGGRVDLTRTEHSLAVVFVYPLTGRPGDPLPTDWDLIPGARGCTPEACGFRELYQDFWQEGVDVFGLSTQSNIYQIEAADRLKLPFQLLSDEIGTFGGPLDLPTFRVDNMTLYKRLTLVIANGSIEHVFYPVFPPDQHAEEVLHWLRRH